MFLSHKVKLKRAEYGKLYIKRVLCAYEFCFAALRLCVKIIARKDAKTQRSKMKMVAL